MMVEENEQRSPEEEAGTRAEEQADQPPQEPPAEGSAGEGPRETPAEEPVGEGPQEPPAEGPAAAETEATPPETDPEVSEEAAREEPAEETPGEQPAEPAAEEEPAAERRAERPAAKDVPPGAELEPIAVEAEQELTAEERARREAEAEERARREAEATADTREEPEPRPRPAAEVHPNTRIQATGKRKSSIARVILTAGDGTIEINSRKLDEYFPRPHHQAVARQALVTAGYEGSVNVSVRVQGGGISGQAGAIRHGIARALTEIEPELRRDLKRRGLLTRDARRKERRKAGLKKARKRPQFSKR
jgi:small subunit ribosomal protein S9